MTEETKDQWAIVHLMGHDKVAGKVSQGWGSLIQIDIPATEKHPAWTKMVGPNAIHSIDFVDEDLGRAIAKLIKAGTVHREIPYEYYQEEYADDLDGEMP